MKSPEYKIREVIVRCNGRVSVAVELPSHSFHIDGDRSYSAASLIKIPILLEAFRQAQEGKYPLVIWLQFLRRGELAGLECLCHFQIISPLL